MMNTFVSLLREIAALLGRFSESEDMGSRQWDGTAYSAAVRRNFDPYASKWWAMLTTIAEMLEGQDAPLSQRQRLYLDRLLFGGMGSLNDLVLDEQRIGPEAQQVNQELRRLTKALFGEFPRV
jgi:hypothetical protein